MKKFYILILCFICSSVFAAEKVSFDDDALVSAIDTIKSIGSKANCAKDKKQKEICKDVDEAKGTLYVDIVENVKSKRISSEYMMTSCLDIIDSYSYCVDFIKTYKKFLDHANFCKEANTIEVKAHSRKIGDWRRYKFKECYNIVKGTSIDEYDSVDIKEKCEKWIKVGEKCLEHLESVYKPLVSNRSIGPDRRYVFECVLRNIQYGDVNFPITTASLEGECDHSYYGYDGLASDIPNHVEYDSIKEITGSMGLGELGGVTEAVGMATKFLK